MKRFVISLMILAFGSGMCAQEDITSTIKKLMKEQERSWNYGRVERFMEHYWKSDSLLFIGSKGPTYGWQQTLDNYKESYPNKEAMGMLTFSYLKVEPLSETSAIVIGGWQLKKKEDFSSGYFSLLWKKIDGKWVIVADHSS